MLKEIERLLLDLKYRRDWSGPGEVDSVIDQLIELVVEEKNKRDQLSKKS